MTEFRRMKALGAATLLFAAFCDAALCAEQADARPTDTGLDEIIVTAQKRSENLQVVPITVAVLTAADIRSAGIQTTQDLASAVPGLDFTDVGPSGTPFLRGVGGNAANPNDEPSVAMYLDDVYLAAPFADIFQFNNIERIEVLKGPQGTLFGRNATGGVIRIITPDPNSSSEVKAEVGYGDYRTYTGSLYATGGFTDNVAANIAIQGSDQQQGFGRNVLLQRDTFAQQSYSIRSKLLFTPNDSLKLKLEGDFGHMITSMNDIRLPQGVLGITGVPSPPGFFDTNTDFLINDHVQTWGLSARLDYDAKIFQFASISSYRAASGTFNSDADGSPSNILIANPLYESQRNWSEELQLTSVPDSPLKWVGGVFIYDNFACYCNGNLSGSALHGVTSSTRGQQHTVSEAVFGQVSKDIVKDTELTLGIRYTHENQDLVGYNTIVGVPGTTKIAPEVSQSFNQPTWRVALDHQFAPDITGYVSYNRGIKSGGFALLSPGLPGYQPEKLDAYEIGAKTELLDRRLRVNVSGFFYNYKEIQVQTYPGLTIVTANAGGAHIKGLDLDFSARATNYLKINGAVEYLDGHYTKYPNAVSNPASPLSGGQVIFDAAGKETIRSPRFTGSLGPVFELPVPVGLLSLDISTTYNSGFFYTADNRLKEPVYALLNASLAWSSADDRYSVHFWGRNLTNREYFKSAVSTTFGDHVRPGFPLTYGITVAARLD